MPHSLLDILKYFLIALIWLLFLRIARAVWVSTRTTPNSTEKESSSAPRRGADYATGTARSGKPSTPLPRPPRQFAKQAVAQGTPSMISPTPSQQLSRSTSQADDPVMASAFKDSYRLDRLTLKIVEPANRAGITFPVQGEVVIGRGANCDIKLISDTFASSKHARIYSRDGLYWLEDLGSTNGTYLNSHRVSSPQRLGQGDRIQLGATILEVHR